MRSLVLAIIVLDVASAGASPSSPDPDPVEAAAQVHLDRGVAAFTAGDYTAAHAELASAQKLVPAKPNPYRWLALTEVQLGDCTRALANIEAFLARVPAGDPRIAELVRLRDLCQRTGVLRVTSRPLGATLKLDGAHVGSAPFTARSINAGTHVVVAERAGFAASSRSVIVPAGAAIDLEIELTPPRQPLTRRWWFWTAVAGVAVTAAGVAVYAATRSDAPALLPPIQCDPTGCRPGGT